MDLRYTTEDTTEDTTEEEQFRMELAGWLASEVPAYDAPPPANDWAARRRYDTGWRRKLFENGYAGAHWPRECGGRDAMFDGLPYRDSRPTMTSVSQTHAPRSRRSPTR